jgi:2-methylcitrate dehydratase PrpD
MQTAAERIAEWALGIASCDIPNEVRAQARLHVLDALGCGLAAHGLGIAGEGRSAMSGFGGVPEATVIGSEKRIPAANAAFANAMLCHGLDFDDTHSDSVCHVGVVIGPAAIAVGEAERVSGLDLVTAIVVGNEIVTRVGMAASGSFHEHGFHPTAICGVFGATAAACRLVGLDQAALVSGLGIAGSFASGVLAFLEDGVATKPIHPAWSAHGAIVASKLAKVGAEGPPAVLEGRFGLYDAFLGREPREIDIAEQLADLGSRWETPRVAYKPYPACHLMHGSLAATAQAAAGSKFSAEEVEEVVVTVPAAVVPSVLEPAHHKLAPRTTYEARFSLQYSTAAMLTHGQVGIETYTEAAIADPRVLKLTRKVRYETKEYWPDQTAFAGGTRIRLKNARTLEADFEQAPGTPENPMSADQVRAKFRANAASTLDDQSVDALEDAILTLDEQPDLQTALAPLTHTPVSQSSLDPHYYHVGGRFTS